MDILAFQALLTEPLGWVGEKHMKHGPVFILIFKTLTYIKNNLYTYKILK